MSVSKYGRILWRGIQKALKPTTRHAPSFNGVPEISSVVHNHMKVTTLTAYNFAAHARRK